MRRFLLLSVLAVLVGLSSASDAWAQAPAKVFLPYFYLDYSDPTSDALLSLSQNADPTHVAPGTGSAITVSAKLQVHGLADVPAFPVVIPPQGTVRVSLRAHVPAIAHPTLPGSGWGNGLAGSSGYGSITLTIPPGLDADGLIYVDAEVASVGSPGGHTLAVSETSRLGASYVGSVVRRATAASRVYVFLQDASGSGNTAYLSLNNGPFLPPVPLPANGNAYFEVTPYLGVGQVAEVEVTGSPLLATPVTVDEVAGTAVAQPALLVPDATQTWLSPPFSLNNGWSVDVGLVNGGTAAAHAHATLYYYNSSGALMMLSGSTVTLPANSGTTFPLSTLVPSIPATVYAATLRLDEVLDSQPQQVSGTVFTSKDGVNLPWPMVDNTSGSSEKSAVGFGLGIGSDDTTAFIGATNLDDYPTAVGLVVSYLGADGHGHNYVTPTYSLDSGGFVRFDLRFLRDSQTRDIYGSVLPLNLTSGSAHLWAENATIKGNDATYSANGRWALQCEQSCGGGLGHHVPDIGGRIEKACIITTPPFPGSTIMSQYYRRSGFVPGPIPGRGTAFFRTCPNTAATPLSICGQKHPFVNAPSELATVLGLRNTYAYVNLAWLGFSAICLRAAPDADLFYDPCSTTPN